MKKASISLRNIYSVGKTGLILFRTYNNVHPPFKFRISPENTGGETGMFSEKLLNPLMFGGNKKVIHT